MWRKMWSLTLRLEVRDLDSKCVYFSVSLCVHTNMYLYPYLKRSSITACFEMHLGSSIVCQPLLSWLFFFLHLKEQKP